MKSTDVEISIEDLKIEISQDHVQVVFGQALNNDEHDDTHEAITRMLIKAMPKFEGFLEGVIDENLCNISVAKNMGLTKQRITQIKNELQKSIMGSSKAKFSI